MAENTKLKEFQESFASVKKKLEEVKASPDSDDSRKMMYEICSYLMNQIYALGDEMYNYTNKHSIGHPPALKTATHMEKYLKACGMDNDVEIVRPTIYMSATNRGVEVFAEYKK